TKRYKLGKLLGTITRHFLLMTATPHNGKEEDFQLFMALLDGDRFEGRFRDGVHTTDVSDLMRRMVKEDLVRFDGTPLFPERKSYTVAYELSDGEAALYKAVTDYVRQEFNRADALQNEGRKGTVGFALTILQRRLAPAPRAAGAASAGGRGPQAGRRGPGAPGRRCGCHGRGAPGGLARPVAMGRGGLGGLRGGHPGRRAGADRGRDRRPGDGGPDHRRAAGRDRDPQGAGGPGAAGPPERHGPQVGGTLEDPPGPGDHVRRPGAPAQAGDLHRAPGHRALPGRAYPDPAGPARGGGG